MAGTFDISTINVISPNGLVTKSLTVDNYGYAKIGDERVGVTPTNWIINGQFDVWQRGTSHSTEGYGSADRWYMALSGATASLSRQSFAIGQTEVPNNPQYFARFQSTVANDLTRIEYHIENVTKLAGKVVSVSFWIKADSQRTVTISLFNVYGTGGSTAEETELKTSIIGTSWQRVTKTFILPSASGKTVASDSYTQLRIMNANFETFTFDIANVCLVEGSVPVECPNEPYGEVLRKCQRYYYRINAIDAYGLLSPTFGVAFQTTSLYFKVELPVEMRAVPTAVEFSTIRATDYTGVFTSSSLGLGGYSNKNIAYVIITTSGLTQYRNYIIHSNNSTAGYIAFTAEL